MRWPFLRSMFGVRQSDDGDGARTDVVAAKKMVGGSR
jgi:hypothetical protein